MVTLKELEQAHEQWIIAQQEFNQAEPEFVEDATHRLTAAELKYNTLIRLAKQKGVQADGKKNMPSMWQRLIQCELRVYMEMPILRERYYKSSGRACRSTHGRKERNRR